MIIKHQSDAHARHAVQADDRPRATSSLSLRCAAAAHGLLLWLMMLAVHADDTLTLRLAYLGEQGSDAQLGALQGLAEANAQGRFLGLRYELVVVTSAAAAAALPAVAIVADLAADALPALATAVDPIAVLNVTSSADHLRTLCGTNLLHVLPSDAMRADAVQQWQRKVPLSTVQAQAWHARFEKYAAAQLNKRYQETAAKPMTDRAWAGWAAVKLVSASLAELHTEAPAALSSNASQALLTQLQTRLAFDGQKGVDMSFRPSGQLRQPLLLVENGQVVGEAPVRGIAGEEDLDSLGPDQCAK